MAITYSPFHMGMNFRIKFWLLQRKCADPLAEECHLYQWLLAPQQSRSSGSAWTAATPEKHRSTGRRKREVTQKQYLFPERKIRDFNMAFFIIVISLLRSCMRRVKTYSALKQKTKRVYLDGTVYNRIRRCPRTERRTWWWHVHIQPLVQCRSLVQWNENQFLSFILI